MGLTGLGGVGEVVRGYPRPLPGRSGDPGLFGPGSLVWSVNGESVLLLGGGRALLMQIAHPLVAAGVADHSDFRRDPFERLWRTVDSALTIAFGDTEQADEAAARVTGIHRRVHGHRDGAAYSALDPGLLLWVHATLVDSSIVAYERFVRPLGRGGRERYYQEMKRAGGAFGIPHEAHPPRFEDFRGYLEETIAGLRVSEGARALARGILSPPTPVVLLPVARLFGLAAVGLLPASIRAGLGLRWTPGNERALGATAALVRACLPLCPSPLRRWPHAREAARRVRDGG